MSTIVQELPPAEPILNENHAAFRNYGMLFSLAPRARPG